MVLLESVKQSSKCNPTSKFSHCFTIIIFMDTQSSFRRALKLAQEQEVTENWRWPKDETELNTLQRLQRSEKAKAERSC